MYPSELFSPTAWSSSSAVAVLCAGIAAGCAHQNKAEQNKAAQATEKVEKLKKRLEEVEKTNGRLSVRIDEMEDEIFLLQDRVEAHRLALRRRKQMQANRSQSQDRAQAPAETPQTNYGRGEGRYRVRNPGRSPRDSSEQPTDEHGYKRPVKRIPLNNDQGREKPAETRSNSGRDTDDSDESASSDEASPGSSEQPSSSATSSPTSEPDGSDEADVVITDSDFRKFARSSGSDSSSDEKQGDASSSSSASEEKREAKKPVTDEKLGTAQQMENEPRPSEAKGEKPFDGKSGLDLYKTALAEYRDGEYATALEGFEAFLDDDPREDYRDNGLYWIGECHYGMGEYQTAVEYFQRLLEETPNGNKVPDAMLKMALAYRELDMTDKARGLLEKLTRRYPSTNAGRLGEKKLSDMES